MIAVYFIRDGLYKYKIIDRGILLVAEVTQQPSICFQRNNEIAVKVNEKVFWLPISRQDCKRNKYGKGDKVNVLWYEYRGQILST